MAKTEKTKAKATPKKAETDKVIVVNGVKYTQMKITVKEIHDLIDVALNLRFLLLILAPKAPKGSSGDKIMKDVNNMGPLLSDIAKRMGHKLPKFGGKCKGKCKDLCKVCERKAKVAKGK